MNIFGIKKSPFKESAAILAEEGFSQGYIEKLREETDALKKPADLAKGRSFLINALTSLGLRSFSQEIGKILQLILFSISGC